MFQPLSENFVNIYSFYPPVYFINAVYSVPVTKYKGKKPLYLNPPGGKKSGSKKRKSSSGGGQKKPAAKKRAAPAKKPPANKEPPSSEGRAEDVADPDGDLKMPALKTDPDTNKILKSDK